MARPETGRSEATSEDRIAPVSQPEAADAKQCDDQAARVGIVAIGRNEGDRLVRCLEVARQLGTPLVYVDSASTDDSPARARALGVDVVELDPTRPMSAARGRNAGFARLEASHPALERVQFIDGDCELAPDWIAVANARLDARPELAAVCGRRRERAREASIYNRLIDLEWDTPVGETQAFGGDVLIRAEIVRALGGYDESLIAGEDPDFAARIVRAGWAIERLDHAMTIHDADLTHFRQWWLRQVRAGHAAAEAWARDSGSRARNRRRLLSIGFWGLGLPLVALLLAPAGLWLLTAYLVLAMRVYRNQRERGRRPSDALLYALSCIEGKLAECYGAFGYLLRRLRRDPPALIEYK